MVLGVAALVEVLVHTLGAEHPAVVRDVEDRVASRPRESRDLGTRQEDCVVLLGDPHASPRAAIASRQTWTILSKVIRFDSQRLTPPV